MNKYLAIFALAIAAACASTAANSITGNDVATSEASLSPSDQEEIVGLTGKALAFKDFCLSFRDYVVDDIKTTHNAKVERVFKLFFNTHEDAQTDPAPKNKPEFPAGSARDVCRTIATYNQELKRRYKSAKEALVAQDRDLRAVTIGNEDCVTVGRIIRLGEVCKYLLAFGGAS